ncbi:unnamed protein product [Peronospora belbahrii]|uniref:Uncharacterized protein n=1 Tax=Peronospora belbahrii TaxID=622444 RepID=A0AAU9KSZ3_9STRA|nr:unnamed protein product [Peronospora belbahrii]
MLSSTVISCNQSDRIRTAQESRIFDVMDDTCKHGMVLRRKTCKHDKQMIAAANMYDGNLMEVPTHDLLPSCEYGWSWSGAAPLVESERTTVLPHRVKKYSLETHRAH